MTASHLEKPCHFVAQHLVLAAPPRKLAPMLTTQPRLPPGLHKALAANPTWVGAQSKFLAVYVTPFWRQACLSGQAFSRVGPMDEVHDASATAHAGHAPFGFIGV